VNVASPKGRAEIFKERRARFMAEIGAAAAILPSAPVAVRSNDVEFIYRQDSDFYYLTGFDEPESVALFAPGHKDGEFVMFVRPRDRERETWTGRRAGVEGAILEYGADKAYVIDELNGVLPRYLEGVESVYYPLGNNERMNARMLDLVRGAQVARQRTGSGPVAMLDPRELIHEARLCKRPEELNAMRRAIAISCEAHKEAMRRARGGMMEWEIEALVDYAFRSRGAAGPSYPSIVASGPNAATLHYIHNDRRMQSGDLLLIDAGCEYDFYASDVTRTFPVGTRFNSAQRAMYSVVLEAQRRGIESIKPGVRFDDVHEAALRVLVEGMIALGLVKGPIDDAIATASYRRYYMHRTSHWLGMDVHDVGRYFHAGKARPLDTAMVITVEPGIYVAENAEGVSEEYRGIGVRIEDDVLVTPEGASVLSSAIPKSIEDVERACQG
jgi:Xaa-Pro aminopeptidase